MLFRKFNVLAKLIIPKILCSLHFIISELEEKEREDNFRLKRFKQLKIKRLSDKLQVCSCCMNLLNTFEAGEGFKDTMCEICKKKFEPKYVDKTKPVNYVKCPKIDEEHKGYLCHVTENTNTLCPIDCPCSEILLEKRIEREVENLLSQEPAGADLTKKIVSLIESIISKPCQDQESPPIIMPNDQQFPTPSNALQLPSRTVELPPFAKSAISDILSCLQRPVGTPCIPAVSKLPPCIQCANDLPACITRESISSLCSTCARDIPPCMMNVLQPCDPFKEEILATTSKVKRTPCNSCAIDVPPCMYNMANSPPPCVICSLNIPPCAEPTCVPIDVAINSPDTTTDIQSSNVHGEPCTPRVPPPSQPCISDTDTYASRVPLWAKEGEPCKQMLEHSLPTPCASEKMLIAPGKTSEKENNVTTHEQSKSTTIQWDPKSEKGESPYYMYPQDVSISKSKELLHPCSAHELSTPHGSKTTVKTTEKMTCIKGQSQDKNTQTDQSLPMLRESDTIKWNTEAAYSKLSANSRAPPCKSEMHGATDSIRIRIKREPCIPCVTKPSHFITCSVEKICNSPGGLEEEPPHPDKESLKLTKEGHPFTPNKMKCLCKSKQAQNNGISENERATVLSSDTEPPRWTREGEPCIPNYFKCSCVLKESLPPPVGAHDQVYPEKSECRSIPKTFESQLPKIKQDKSKLCNECGFKHPGTTKQIASSPLGQPTTTNNGSETPKWTVEGEPCRICSYTTLVPQPCPLDKHSTTDIPKWTIEGESCTPCALDVPLPAPCKLEQSSSMPCRLDTLEQTVQDKSILTKHSPCGQTADTEISHSLKQKNTSTPCTSNLSNKVDKLASKRAELTDPCKHIEVPGSQKPQINTRSEASSTNKLVDIPVSIPCNSHTFEIPPSHDSTCDMNSEDESITNINKLVIIHITKTYNTDGSYNEQRLVTEKTKITRGVHKEYSGKISQKTSFDKHSSRVVCNSKRDKRRERNRINEDTDKATGKDKWINKEAGEKTKNSGDGNSIKVQCDRLRQTKSECIDRVKQMADPILRSCISTGSPKETKDVGTLTKNIATKASRSTLCSADMNALKSLNSSKLTSMESYLCHPIIIKSLESEVVICSNKPICKPCSCQTLSTIGKANKGVGQETSDVKNTKSTITDPHKKDANLSTTDLNVMPICGALCQVSRISANDTSSLCSVCLKTELTSGPLNKALFELHKSSTPKVRSNSSMSVETDRSGTESHKFMCKLQKTSSSRICLKCLMPISDSTLIPQIPSTPKVKPGHRVSIEPPEDKGDTINEVRTKITSSIWRDTYTSSTDLNDYVNPCTPTCDSKPCNTLTCPSHDDIIKINDKDKTTKSKSICTIKIVVKPSKSCETNVERDTAGDKANPPSDLCRNCLNKLSGNVHNISSDGRKKPWKYCLCDPHIQQSQDDLKKCNSSNKLAIKDSWSMSQKSLGVDAGSNISGKTCDNQSNNTDKSVSICSTNYSRLSVNQNASTPSTKSKATCDLNSCQKKEVVIVKSDREIGYGHSPSKPCGASRMFKSISSIAYKPCVSCPHKRMQDAETSTKASARFDVRCLAQFPKTKQSCDSSIPKEVGRDGCSRYSDSGMKKTMKKKSPLQSHSFNEKDCRYFRRRG